MHTPNPANVDRSTDRTGCSCTWYHREIGFNNKFWAYRLIIYDKGCNFKSSFALKDLKSLYFHRLNHKLANSLALGICLASERRKDAMKSTNHGVKYVGEENNQSKLDRCVDPDKSSHDCTKYGLEWKNTMKMSFIEMRTYPWLMRSWMQEDQEYKKMAAISRLHLFPFSQPANETYC